MSPPGLRERKKQPRRQPLLSSLRYQQLTKSTHRFCWRPLFHSEGFDLLGLFSRGTTVREFTVGELYEAVCRAISHVPKC